MTPMIDVVFQLLIFFVCTVEFQRAEDGLTAALPAAAANQEPAGPSPQELDLGLIEVAVEGDRIRVRFQGREQAFAAAPGDDPWQPLGRQLRTWGRIDAAIPVRITCRPDVSTGSLLRVYDVCLQTGMTDVRIAHQQ